MAISNFTIHPYDVQKIVVIIDGVKQFGKHPDMDSTFRLEKVKGKKKLYFSVQAHSTTIANALRKDSQNLSMEICVLYETSGEGHLDTNLAEYLGDVFVAKSTSHLDFKSGYPAIHFIFTEV